MTFILSSVKKKINFGYCQIFQPSIFSHVIWGTKKNTDDGGFCPNFEICMGCFVHVILLDVGCFVSLQKNMWWFLSTCNKMDVGCFVRGVFCPYTCPSNYLIPI